MSNVRWFPDDYGSDGIDWNVSPTDYTNSTHSGVAVYLRNSGHIGQVEALAALLDRYAPDGVVTTDAADARIAALERENARLRRNIVLLGDRLRPDGSPDDDDLALLKDLAKQTASCATLILMGKDIVAILGGDIAVAEHDKRAAALAAEAP